MHPQEFLAFVHHADETAEAGIFGFEQGVEFAQGGIFGSVAASQPLLNLFKAHGVGFKWFYFVQGLEPTAAIPSQIPVATEKKQAV